MRIIWDALEKVDFLAIELLDKLDSVRGKEPLLERTKKETAHVRTPQRVIAFEE